MLGRLPDAIQVLGSLWVIPLRILVHILLGAELLLWASLVDAPARRAAQHCALWVSVSVVSDRWALFIFSSSVSFFLALSPTLILFYSLVLLLPFSSFSCI